MITGFNTDIEHNGVIYHVQTEDKGLDSPLILSLVYAGGAILASKRSRYEDLIATGFDEEALAERLKRQHRLICAAINAGRIDDLKRMGRPVADETVETEIASPAAEPVSEPVEAAPEESEVVEAPAQEIREPEDGEIIHVALHELMVNNADDYDVLAETATPPPVETEPTVTVLPPEDYSPYTVHDSRRQSEVRLPPRELGVIVSILEEEEYRAGQIYNIRVLVEHRTESGGRALAGVPLSVKILGTMFRPQLYSVKTGRDGVAVISAHLPLFTSGRAAILIRADAEGKAIETRRVIYAAL